MIQVKYPRLMGILQKGESSPFCSGNRPPTAGILQKEESSPFDSGNKPPTDGILQKEESSPFDSGNKPPTDGILQKEESSPFYSDYYTTVLYSCSAPDIGTYDYYYDSAVNSLPQGGGAQKAVSSIGRQEIFSINFPCNTVKFLLM